tara:strand:- start:374 stop:961 length:588 start_codon:yes stop_codon:yes gene_type:complete
MLHEVAMNKKTKRKLLPTMVISNEIGNTKYSELRDIWFLWPSCEKLCVRTAHFFTDNLKQDNNSSLLGTTITSAINKWNICDGDLIDKYANFVEEVIDHLPLVMGYEVYVKQIRPIDEPQWDPVETPLQRWLEGCKKYEETVIVRSRDMRRFGQRNLRMLLSAHILGSDDVLALKKHLDSIYHRDRFEVTDNVAS